MLRTRNVSTARDLHSFGCLTHGGCFAGTAGIKQHQSRVACFDAPVSTAQHCSGSVASLAYAWQLSTAPARCFAAVLMLAVGESTSIYTNVTFICKPLPMTRQASGGLINYLWHSHECAQCSSLIALSRAHNASACCFRHACPAASKTLPCAHRLPACCSTGPGLSPSALAAAIAVPVGVGVLAGGLLLSWLLKRHRRQQGASGVSGKGPSRSSSAFKDVEIGGFPPAGPPPPSDASRSRDQAGFSVVEGAGSMPISYVGSSVLWSSPSGYTAATTQSSVDADALTAINSTPSMQSAQPPHSLQQQQQQPLYAAALPVAGPAAGSSIRRGVAMGASSGAGERSRRLSWHLSVANREDPLHVLQGSSSVPMQEGSAHLVRGAATPDNSFSTRPASVSSARQNSGSTAEPGTPKHSLDMQLLPPAAGSSSEGTVADDRRSAVFTLLKQRSDVAVLRDLTIGPLLGRGSYGRLYRGAQPCVLAGSGGSWQHVLYNMLCCQQMQVASSQKKSLV